MRVDKKRFFLLSGVGTKCVFGVLTQCIEMSNVTVKAARFHEICGLETQPIIKNMVHLAE